MRSSFTRVVLFAALAACASSSGTRTFVAPSNDTVSSDTEVRPGNPPVYVITVRNSSSVPITVWNTSIYDCQNVRDNCLPKTTNIKISPFGSAVVARIEPERTQQGLSYKFRYSWRPDSSSGSAAISALAAVDPKLSGVLRELRPNDFRALAGKITAIRPDPDSIVIQPGEGAEFDMQRVLVLGPRDSVLGYTRMVRLSFTPGPGLQFIPGGMRSRVIGRSPARGKVVYSLASEMETLIGQNVPPVDMPIVVAYPIDPNAPVFAGRVLDADARTPLGCVRVGIEDSAQNVVSRARADSAGVFWLKTPRAGTYKLRVEASGWYPWYGTPTVAASKEEKHDEHLVKFTEQLLSARPTVGVAEYEPARPTAVRFESGTARPANRNTPVIHGVDLTGSAVLPILNIASPLPTQSLWAQFTVDTAGRVDTTSILMPAGTAASVRAAVRYVMPRVRFSPARDEGRVVCELTRLQVNISPR